MNTKKAIDVLNDLKDYVNENWDESEHKQEMDDAEAAINLAVSVLSESDVAGTLSMGDKTYLVCESN